MYGHNAFKLDRLGIVTSVNNNIIGSLMYVSVIYFCWYHLIWYFCFGFVGYVVFPLCL